MSSINEIIKKIQKDLYCPVCGKSYDVSEIKLRGLFDHTLIIQTVCVNKHVTLFMTSFERKGNKKPLTSDNILDLHNALKEFDGDFEKVLQD